MKIEDIVFCSPNNFSLKTTFITRFIIYSSHHKQISINNSLICIRIEFRQHLSILHNIQSDCIPTATLPLHNITSTWCRAKQEGLGWDLQIPNTYSYFAWIYRYKVDAEEGKRRHIIEAHLHLSCAMHETRKTIKRTSLNLSPSSAPNSQLPGRMAFRTDWLIHRKWSNAFRSPRRGASRLRESNNITVHHQRSRHRR